LQHCVSTVVAACVVVCAEVGERVVDVDEWVVEVGEWVVEVDEWVVEVDEWVVEVDEWVVEVDEWVVEVGEGVVGEGVVGDGVVGMDVGIEVGVTVVVVEVVDCDTTNSLSTSVTKLEIAVPRPFVQDDGDVNKLEFSALEHDDSEQYSQQYVSYAALGQPEHNPLSGLRSQAQLDALEPVS